MAWLCWLIFLADMIPFWQASRALRRTSLTHALAWALSAWLAWGGVLLSNEYASAIECMAVRYLAMCLIGCAGMAVLGARRPGVAAWDFVVFGLLAVVLLFLAEGLLVGGEVRLGPVRIVFLTVTLAISICNYLPTRLAIAALMLGVGCSLELWRQMQPAGSGWQVDGRWAELLILLAPLMTLTVRWLPQSPPDEIDRLWRGFRDSFGLIWGLRVREQFNRAAANAGLPVELRWSGLRSATGDPPDSTARSASLPLLRALLKRFGPEEEAARAESGSAAGYPH